MLSRRNIRIKVMQVLYAATAKDKPTSNYMVDLYQNKIEGAFELFIFNFYLVTEVARFSESDDLKRKSKHLPNKMDKAFSAKLFNNELIQSFVQDPYIQKTIKKGEFVEKAGDDMAEVTYKKFIKANQNLYENFILNSATTNEDVREIILALYKYCVKESEIFIETIWAHYPSWIDDDSLVIGATKKLIKSLPKEADFYKEYLPDTDAVNAFGKELTRYLGQNDEQLLKIIVPELKNWESDRLATVDMILLKMGIAEFLNCPTIPTKVTINEYVELAKAYSTDKSKEFVNGLLDKICRVLDENKQINKEGRGLLT